MIKFTLEKIAEGVKPRRLKAFKLGFFELLVAETYGDGAEPRVNALLRRYHLEIYDHDRDASQIFPGCLEMWYSYVESGGW